MNDGKLWPTWMMDLFMLCISSMLVFASMALWHNHQPVEVQAWFVGQVKPEAYIQVDMNPYGTRIALNRADYQIAPLPEAPFYQKEEKQARPLAVSAEQDTKALMKGVVRGLVKEEVESFLYRVQLATEVGKHIAKKF